MPKLSDPTYGLRETELERVELDGQTLTDHRAFWDRSAEVDAIRAISDQDTDESFEHSGRKDRDSLLPLLPPGGSGVALEIGCGIGRIVQHLAPHCAEVIGVDISAEMVAQGRARLAHLPNVRVELGNGYDLGDVGDDSLDLVYSFYVLQHMPKTTVFNYFREAMRVLRPGGVLAFQLPNILLNEHFLAFHHFTQPYFVEHPYPMNFYTPAEVAALLVHAGFRVERLDDPMVVVARKTGQPGVADGVLVESGAESSEPTDLAHHALSEARRLGGRGYRVARRIAARGRAAVRSVRS